MNGEHRARVTTAWPLWAALTLGACGPVDPCVALSERALPHVPSLARFAAIADRIVSADSAFDDPRLLEESLFSSVRGDPEVLAAWVERTGAAPLAIGYPHGAAPPELSLTSCRVTPRDSIEVGEGEIHVGDSPGPAVVLRRRFRRAPQELAVTMAFASP